MRISDWSSDVCSSDLADGRGARVHGGLSVQLHRAASVARDRARRPGRMAEPCGRAADLSGARRAAALLPLGFAPGLRSAHRLCAVDQQRGGVEPARGCAIADDRSVRSEEQTSELQSLMRISYAVFCLTKKKH